ncbi:MULTISPECIES: peptide deformylase [unclassified Rhizobium]|uniref:peptide deformylase n=1 Tax=unclassified Rhizobium TaxID=2613769 RepID=UPI003D2CC602
MTIKPLIILPDPVLRQVSQPIERVDADTLKLADDMLETMYEAPGIGLAAIQIGVPRRMLVIDISREGEEKTPLVIINPEILKVSDEGSVYDEGCLSIPEYYAEVERPAAVTVKHVGRDGKDHVLEADGLLATCLQHEIDHLNGVLFIDHISRLKRDMVIKRFTKAAKAKAV